MRDFSYHAPTSLAEAQALHAQAPLHSRFLAGGTDLFLFLEHGGGDIGTVIDLKAIPGIAEIQQGADGGLRLGALTTMRALENHPDIATRFQALAAAAAVVGGPAIRNRATLGGNLCNASPAADTSVPLLALAAQVVVQSPAGERTMALAELWAGPRKNTLAAGEILREIVLPAPGGRWGCDFQRLTRSAMDIALVNAAAVVKLDDGGAIAAAACALGAVGPTVLPVPGLDEALRGAPCDEKTWQTVAELAQAAARPIDDQRASADYRRQMAGVLARRAAKNAAARAENNAAAGAGGAAGTRP